MDNAPGVRFVSLTFLVGFAFGTFVGVMMALIAVAIAIPEDEEPLIIEVPVYPTATTTSTPEPTPPSPLRSLAAVAVKVGPGDEFATLGTLSRGDAVEVIGRDFDSQWVAIRFPAGSNVRGWIPAAAVEGLSFSDLRSLAVLLPTPLPTQAVTPPPFPEASGTPGTGTPTPDITLGPPSVDTDLAVLEVSVLEDGRVRIRIENAGPGDLTQGLLIVTVRTLSLSSETLNYAGGLPAGATLTLTTTSFVVGEEPVEVQVVIDPSSVLADPDRTNNVLTSTVSRPVEPSPTPSPTATEVGPG